MRISVQPILNELGRLSSPAIVSGETDTRMDVDGHTLRSLPDIGDLEPPLPILQLLTSADAIQDDVEYLLSEDPLTSLFKYEFGQPKPPPPPPPPKPRGRKPKADRSAEYANRRLQKQAAAADAAERAKNDIQAVLDSSPGFRAPRTRHAVAAAAAFEAEAHSSGSGSGGEVEVGVEIVVPPEASSSAPTATPAKRAPKRKRIPTVLPGQSEVPPMVDDVDNQRSFKLFDEGWILPPDQKRGGRAPPDRHVLPLPRKRVRSSGWCPCVFLTLMIFHSYSHSFIDLSPLSFTDVSLDRPASHLSVFSTPASENRTLQTTSPPVEPQEPETAKTDTHAMNVDTIPWNIAMPPPPLPLRPPPPPSGSDYLAQFAAIAAAQPRQNINTTFVDSSIIINRITTPSGGIIIEELDTPAIRRQKHMRRKAEKLRLSEVNNNYVDSAVAASSSSSTTFPVSRQEEEVLEVEVQAEAGPSRLPPANDVYDIESDLSSLSDSEDEGPGLHLVAEESLSAFTFPVITFQRSEVRAEADTEMVDSRVWPQIDPDGEVAMEAEGEVEAEVPAHSDTRVRSDTVEDTIDADPELEDKDTADSEGEDVRIDEDEDRGTQNAVDEPDVQEEPEPAPELEPEPEPPVSKAEITVGTILPGGTLGLLFSWSYDLMYC